MTITITRANVEADIKRVTDKGRSRMQAIVTVKANAERGQRVCQKEIEAIEFRAGGKAKLNDSEKKRIIGWEKMIDLETQRLGHLNNIVIEETSE